MSRQSSKYKLNLKLWWYFDKTKLVVWSVWSVNFKDLTIETRNETLEFELGWLRFYNKPHIILAMQCHNGEVWRGPISVMQKCAWLMLHSRFNGLKQADLCFFSFFKGQVCNIPSNTFGNCKPVVTLGLFCSRPFQQIKYKSQTFETRTLFLEVVFLSLYMSILVSKASTCRVLHWDPYTHP